MRALLRAYPTLLRVGFAEAVAYRAEMVVWMLTTTMPLVSLALWHTVAAGSGGRIGRYGSGELTGYFLAQLIVRQLTSAWVVWEMNFEIRTGALSMRLLRPIHPLLAYSAENLAALPLRGLFSLPIAAILLLTASGAHFPSDPVLVAALVASVVGAWAINFLAGCCIGSLGFFIEQASSVFEVWLALFFVLSGYLFPLEFTAQIAPWLPQAARALPFYYMINFPIELMLGMEGRAEALSRLAVEWCWVAAFFGLAVVMWRAGLRRFNAVGA